MFSKEKMEIINQAKSLSYDIRKGAKSLFLTVR